MTLGQLIDRLKEEDPKERVATGFGHPHSYRGYYDNLAFEPVSDTTIREMIECAESALGETYHGYKGGQYKMGEYTECWLAMDGDTGETLGEATLVAMLQRPLLLGDLI